VAQKPSRPVTAMSVRTPAPHVQAALAPTAQARMPDHRSAQGRPHTPPSGEHVRQALAQVQAKRAEPASQRSPAAHVPSAGGAVQNRQPARHVGAALGGGVQAKVAPASLHPQASTGRPPAPVRIHSNTIQRDKVAPVRIAEGQWAQVGPGGDLNFTALAAGCLAVVAEFANGGGAGVHLALNMDNERQWTNFRNAIAAKRISAAHLYSDMIGQDDGWQVKVNEDTYEPETEWSPRSAPQAALAGGNGWVNAGNMVRDWFAATLGTGTVTITDTRAAVVHRCP